MMEFDKCAKESFINQYIKGSAREGATPNLLLGNKLRQVTEVTVGSTLGEVAIILFALK